MKERLNEYENTSTEEIQIYAIESTLAHFWCPYCGGWHGNGPPPSGRAAATPATRVPDSIGKIVRNAMEAETNVRWKPRAEQWRGKGEVDSVPADIQQRGNSMKVAWTDSQGVDPYNHREIVTHDGVNAAYVRDLDEHVIVDDSQSRPYEPYTRDTSNRYTFE